MGEAFTGWVDLLAGRAPLGEVFSGPLGWQEGPAGQAQAHVSRHASYAGEAGLVCLATGFGGEGVLARVADYARQEYWGERALVVKCIFPRHARGIGWESRQSALIELAPEWRSLDARHALGELEDSDAERLMALLAGGWSSMVEARRIADSCAPAQGRAAGAPRI